MYCLLIDCCAVNNLCAILKDTPFLSPRLWEMGQVSL